MQSTKTGRTSPFVPRPTSSSRKKEYPPTFPPKPAYSEPKPHEPRYTNGNEPRYNGHGGRNGYENGYVIEESSTVEIIESKSIVEAERETKVEVVDITAGLLELLTIGETDVNGVVIVERGEYFLESIMRRFQIEFFERWKIEFLFPAIKCWLEKHIMEYIERILITTREKLIKEYEEKIIIIKEEHRCEIERREKHHREIYLAAIRRAWEAYEKSMENIEFVKEVRFKYSATDEREVWGEFIKDLAPELVECVPKIYTPEFCIDERR